MPTGAFPPFAHITHPNGIPLMPPPIMTVPSHTMPNQQNIQPHCKYICGLKLRIVPPGKNKTIIFYKNFLKIMHK